MVCGHTVHTYHNTPAGGQQLLNASSTVPSQQVCCSVQKYTICHSSNDKAKKTPYTRPRSRLHARTTVSPIGRHKAVTVQLRHTSLRSVKQGYKNPNADEWVPAQPTQTQRKNSTP